MLDLPSERVFDQLGLPEWGDEDGRWLRLLSIMALLHPEASDLFLEGLAVARMAGLEHVEEEASLTGISVPLTRKKVPDGFGVSLGDFPLSMHCEL